MMTIPSGSHGVVMCSHGVVMMTTLTKLIEKISVLKQLSCVHLKRT